MGTARWSPEDWDAYVKGCAGKSASAIFASRRMHDDFDPKRIKSRESCDSTLNPLSTPIIVAIDQTGSMGYLAEDLIRKGLGVLMEEIYARKPVPDPHLMCMAIGDAWSDTSPLQVTQFEADLRLADQLSKFFIEANGGGNEYESYNLPWYFAATRTKCDCMRKRGKKGYLFTVGDEPPPPALLAKHVDKFLGGGLQRDMKTADVLKLAQKEWQVFHIIIEEGSFCRRNPDKTIAAWRALLGQHALTLSEHANLAELIVSTIQIMEGSDLMDVTTSWSGNAALIVQQSLRTLTPALAGHSKGVVRF